MTHKIDAMIAELDIDKLRSVVHTGEIEPRPYQWLVYEKKKFCFTIRLAMIIFRKEQGVFSGHCLKCGRHAFIQQTI